MSTTTQTHPKPATTRSKLRFVPPKPRKSMTNATSMPPIDPPLGPPDIDRPIVIRPAVIRYQRTRNKQEVKRSYNKTTTRTGEPFWMPLMVTIPREVALATGMEAGMTVMMEGYADGRVRVFPAGDLVTRSESEV